MNRMPNEHDISCVVGDLTKNRDQSTVVFNISGICVLVPVYKLMVPCAAYDNDMWRVYK